ncbi:MAG: tetratricopeptide repeat protein [Beijerinckiaceae bacterium]
MSFALRPALRALLLLLSPALLAGPMAAPARAQFFERSQPQPQADVGALMLRIDRLEREVRALTGQLEETQFQLRRLQEQTGRPPQAEEPRAPGRRGEMFDPSLGQRGEAPGGRSPLDGRPGVAGPLGGAVAGDPAEDPNAPLDLLNPRRPRAPNAGLAPGPSPLGQTPPSAPLASGPAPAVAAAPSASAEPPAQPTVSGPRAEYEAALAQARANQLDAAEASLADFIARYPSSQLAPGAMYNLGDVYARRGRHREAAEQFLKVSTDFSKSPQAPQSLWRLGQSLERLGAKEQACAAWAEIGRKHPGASANVKAGAERDMKRVQC